MRRGRDKTAEIFSYIILNALQAMEGEGTLTMISDQVDGKIVVKIKDAGPGIPKEYLSKIFDPYFTTKAQGEGNGMGLNIAYRVVEKYGGQITVDSPESQGATFTVTI